MSRSGRRAGWGAPVGVVAGLVTAMCFAEPAAATMKFGAVQISGNIDSQNIVRHPSPENFQFIQNRNTVQLRFDWDWLQSGKLMDKFDVPFLKKSKVFLLYRGVYDGVYDIAPGGEQRGLTGADDRIGGPLEGNAPGTCRAITDLDGSGNTIFPCPDRTGYYLRQGQYSRLDDDARDSLKIENVLREAYIDLSLKDAPISFRIGRQQVIWGESDQFRLMDIWNPLDLSWHLQQEGFDKIRIPLWLIKALWDVGSVGPFSNVFVEGVYNPFDFQPGAKVGFLPQPWAVPIPNPTRPGQVQFLPGGGAISPRFDLNGTSFKRGDFERTPEEASEVGGRIHGVTPQGLEMTANYLYGRSRSIGAFAGAPFALKIDNIRFSDAAPVGYFGGINQPINEVIVDGEVKHPYTHIFGLTGNYFEGDFTQAVLRMEMAYQLGAAVQSVEEGRRPVTDIGARIPIGYDRRNLWSGMIGFDRPTWIRWLNEKGTWFISGQFFWSYVNGSAGNLRAPIFTAAKRPYFTPVRGQNASLNASNGFDTWRSGPYTGLVERVQDGAFAGGNEDDVRKWEILTTLAATSFYRGGTVVPFIATGFDPVNRNFLAQLQLEYFYTNDFVITVQQKYYTDFDLGPSIDPWGAGGLNARRDETTLKLTYQF